MATLNSEIKSELTEEGACLVGFADISNLPAEIRDSMKFAVSMAVALDASVINEISNGPTKRYYQEYKKANEFLSYLCKQTVDNLKRHGNNATAIEPTIVKLDFETLATNLPHKTVATRAGLGWIGKSALLITKEYGPAIRLATVLTDAEFEVAEPIEKSYCGDCDKCVTRCPVDAISGKTWKPGLKREVIYDAFKCCDNTQNVSAKIGVVGYICGICINACPWTQKYISRQNTD
ncbi:MAG: 4Fe-4S double cluster binding domain-containing protein [Planctomycetota bacterium]|jgi:epoxyqueuosine reductase QueG